MTAWAGPAPSAAQAVRVAARVLRLPPGMRVTVEGFSQDEPPHGWEWVGVTTVEDADTAF